MAYVQLSGNQRTLPRWLADFGGREKMAVFPAKLDLSGFANAYGVDVQVNGAAIQGATSITVLAMQPPAPSVVPISNIGQILIPRGSTIVFDATLGKVAITTANVLQGQTTISVQPLPTALTGTEDAKFSRYGSIFVPSGTLVGRTFATRDTGSGLFSPATNPDLFDEVYLTYFDVANLLNGNDVEFVRPNRAITIKENYLPNWTAQSADVGIVDPTVAPTLSAAGADAAGLPTGTYFVQYSYGNAFGETKPSPTSTQATTNPQHITVASPGAFPTNATYMKIYVSPSTTVANTQLQGIITAAGAYNILTPGTGASPKTTNSSRGGLGKQLDYIRRAYTCIRGLN